MRCPTGILGNSRAYRQCNWCSQPYLLCVMAFGVDEYEIRHTLWIQWGAEVYDQEPSQTQVKICSWTGRERHAADYIGPRVLLR